MTPHERFTACMRFEPVDHVPFYDLGPWTTTLRRWQKEGLGEGNQPPQYEEPHYDPWTDCGVYLWMLPRYPEDIIEETEKFITRRTARGLVQKTPKSADEMSMPEWISNPVESPSDWYQLKKRFDPSHPERFPSDWASRCTRWHQESPVLMFFGPRSPSLFGFIRELLGVEKALIAFYEEPAMVHDMMEHMTELIIAVIPKLLAQAPLTMFIFFEDMCYKGGSLISPAMVREFMLPRYRRIVDALRARGVDLIFVDSDGDVTELIPLWLEVGINGIYPVQQISEGMNPLKLRTKYGRNLVLNGGIDKRVLAENRKAIDDELAIKMPLVKQGGYVPFLDHHIPHNVPYENFVYYWGKKEKLLGLA